MPVVLDVEGVDAVLHPDLVTAEEHAQVVERPFGTVGYGDADAAGPLAAPARHGVVHHVAVADAVDVGGPDMSLRFEVGAGRVVEGRADKFPVYQVARPVDRDVRDVLRGVEVEQSVVAPDDGRVGQAVVYHRVAVGPLRVGRARTDPFVGHPDGENPPLGVETQAVDAGGAAVGGRLAERPAVVDDVPLVLARDADHRVVSGAGGHPGILLQDLPDALEGPERRVCDGIGHAVVGASPAAFAPHEVVFALPLEHEGSFDVVLGGYLLEGFAVLEGNDAQQVGGQADHVAVPPSSVVHVVLPVVVAEDELVDGLCSVDDPVDERSSQCIPIGAFGPVGDGYADAARLVVALDIVAAEEEVILSVGMDRRGGPHRPPDPADLVRGDNPRVFRPADQVLRREGVEEGLFVVGRRPGGEDPVFVAEDHPFGVGIPPLEERVAAPFVRGGIRCLGPGCLPGLLRRDGGLCGEQHEKGRSRSVESFHLFGCFVRFQLAKIRKIG